MKKTLICFACLAIVALMALAPQEGYVKHVLSKEVVEVINDSHTASILADTHSELSPSQLAELKTILLSDKTYEFDYITDAIFIPTSTFTLQSGDRVVKVRFSDHAQQVEFVYEDSPTFLNCEPGLLAIHQLVQTIEKR